MDLKYSNACKEIEVLFDYFLDEKDLSKIPAEQMENIRNNANSQFIYAIDETKPLEEQQISKEAKAIIINIYERYFATEEQKNGIREILYLNKKKEKQEKREKYNTDDIFKKSNNVQNTENSNNSALTEYKESIFKRFKKFIFKILHIRK